MTGLLLLLVASNVATVIGFLIYLGNRDEQEATDRQKLLDRIQAPEKAALGDFEPNDIRHVPFDDDRAFNELSNG